MLSRSLLGTATIENQGSKTILRVSRAPENNINKHTYEPSDII